MPAIVLTTLQTYNTALSVTGDTCQVFATGDVDGANLWGDGNNASFKTLQAILTPATNGKLLIANTTSGMFEQALPTGTNGVTVTAGAGSLQFGQTWSGDISITSGVTAARAEVIGKQARAEVRLDLSGAAQNDVVIYHADRASTLVSITLLYTEASSSDAGVTVTVGKESNSAYYYTGTSEVSKAKWYELAATPLATDIAAGDTVICSNAGGKTGAGEILVIIEYTVN